MSTLMETAHPIRRIEKVTPGFDPPKEIIQRSQISGRDPRMESGFPGLTFSTSDCLTGHLKSDTISMEG